MRRHYNRRWIMVGVIVVVLGQLIYFDANISGFYQAYQGSFMRCFDRDVAISDELIANEPLVESGIVDYPFGLQCTWRMNDGRILAIPTSDWWPTIGRAVGAALSWLGVVFISGTMLAMFVRRFRNRSVSRWDRPGD